MNLTFESFKLKHFGFFVSRYNVSFSAVTKPPAVVICFPSFDFNTPMCCRTRKAFNGIRKKDSSKQLI